jgi:hypothetical protein
MRVRTWRSVTAAKLIFTGVKLVTGFYFGTMRGDLKLHEDIGLENDVLAIPRDRILLV